MRPAMFHSPTLPFSKKFEYRDAYWMNRQVCRSKAYLFGGVEIRMTISANDRSPAIVRKIKSMFAVDVLPAYKFRGLGIKDETIKVEDQGLYHIQILTHAILMLARHCEGDALSPEAISFALLCDCFAEFTRSVSKCSQ